jgi:spore cortex biosynthesis protein YabQ
VQQETVVYYQVIDFTVTIILGLFIGFAYDLLRVLRRLLRPSRQVLFFWDLFFWLCVTFVAFTALLAVNWGEVRAYVMIGLGIGCAFYALFLTNHIYRMLNLTVQTAVKICKMIITPIIRPVRFVFAQLLRLEKALTGRAVAGKKAIAGRVTRGNVVLREKIKEKLHNKRRN